MSLLHSLPKSTARSAKRVGRGIGSGKGGHTASRGQKGQRSRAGGGIPIWFEGGQLPLIKRLPMLRGKAKFEVTSRVATLTLTEIQRLSVTAISLETLRVAGVLPRGARSAKIIATGSLTKPVTVTGLRVTTAAKTAIEAAGGRVE